MSKINQLKSICESIALADSTTRREVAKKLIDIPGVLGNFAAELAATNCEARETTLVISNPSPYTTAAAEANSIEIFPKPPAVSDLIAIAAGEKLTNTELLIARNLTNRDFIQLLGFHTSDDMTWANEIKSLQELDQKVSEQDLAEVLSRFENEEVLELAFMIASSLANQVPVVIDGARSLLAASIVYEFSVAARSWLFVVDSPKSPAGRHLFKHRNWISIPANQVAAGDGLAAIAALSLARTAALLVRH